MHHINIEEFSNGELSQQINRELQKVAANIADPNTEAKAARKITVTIGFKVNEHRDVITASVNADSKLAPTLGTVAVLGMARDLRTGEIELAEIGKQIPGQMSLEDAGVPGMETGGTSSGEIVDLRKTRQA